MKPGGERSVQDQMASGASSELWLSRLCVEIETSSVILIKDKSVDLQKQGQKFATARHAQTSRRGGNRACGCRVFF